MNHESPYKRRNIGKWKLGALNDLIKKIISEKKRLIIEQKAF